MTELAEGGCGVCIYNGADGDMPEFVDERIVKARKAHRCCECRDEIPVGTEYERVSGKWDSDVVTYHTCLPCHEIRRALCCEGWTYTMLWEDADDSEIFSHLTTGCLDKLTTAAAKAKLLGAWRKWKGLA